MKKKRDAPGRPHEFEERYCDMLIEHRKQGHSYESFAAVIGKCRATLYFWERDFPQFLDAKKRAREVSLKTLESIGIALATGKLKGNPAAWIFIMKNHHQDLYKEQPEMSDESIEDLVFSE